MIINAKDLPLKKVGFLPDVGDVLMDWFQELTFTKITKTVVNYENVEAETEYTMHGVRQPLNAQQLEMKPEGQRRWRWEMIHALPTVELFNDDVVVFDGVRYRVKDKWNWKEYGFIEYHIVEDYEAA